MDEEVGLEQAAEHQAAQTAAMDVSHTQAALQAVTQDAFESRAALSAASNETGQRGATLAEELRDGMSEELAGAVEEWTADAQDSLDAAQDAAAAFFESAQEQIDTCDDAGQQQLTMLADQAAQAVRDFAVQLDQQSQAVLNAVSPTQDDDASNDMRDALSQAAEQADALRDQFDATMQQLNDQLNAAQVDSDRANQLSGSDQARQNDQGTDDELQQIVSEALDRVEADQYDAGRLLELQPHKAAPDARDEMEVNGSTHQSAHAGPQKALESIEHYDAGNVLTRIMERDRHSDMDAGWKREFRERAGKGETDMSVRDLYDAVSRSIDAASSLTQQEKNSHKAHLSDELFAQLGLEQEDRVRMPYSKR